MTPELFVLRKGGFYLQGSNGWGSRDCATPMPKAQADRALSEWKVVLASLPPEKLAEVLALEPATTGAPAQRGLFE